MRMVFGNKTQFSRVGAEWSVVLAEKKSPPLSFAASELWLISHSERERRGREDEDVLCMLLMNAPFSFTEYRNQSQTGCYSVATPKPSPVSLPTKDFLGVIDFFNLHNVHLL